MASVRKRTWTGSDGKPCEAWCVEYTDADGKRRRATPKTGLKKDAEKLRQKVERELADGTHVARSETVTVAEGVDLWLAECEKRSNYKDLTRQTLTTYRGMGGRVRTTIGGMKLTDVTHDTAQRLVDQLADKYAARTVNHTVAALMRMLDFAVTEGLLKVNPVRLGRLHTPRAERAARIPTRAEIEHVLAVSQSRKPNEQERTRIMRHAMFCLALFSTLRRGEVCGLRWCDVDLDKCVIRVKQARSHLDGVKGPKTAAGVRQAPMPSIVREALEAIPHPRGEYVFTRRNGALPNPGNLHLYWYYLAQKAGLSEPRKPGKRFGRPLYRFHDMRHGAASLLIAQGANPLHVQRAMGHASVQTTLGIYGHLFEDDDTVRTAADAISATFSAPKTRHSALSPT